MKISSINNALSNNSFKGALAIDQAIGHVFIPEDVIKYAYIDADHKRHPGNIDIFIRTKNDEVYDIKHAVSSSQDYQKLYKEYINKLKDVFSGKTESINGVTIGGENEFCNKFRELETRKQN